MSHGSSYPTAQLAHRRYWCGIQAAVCVGPSEDEKRVDQAWNTFLEGKLRPHVNYWSVWCGDKCKRLKTLKSIPQVS